MIEGKTKQFRLSVILVMGLLLLIISSLAAAAEITPSEYVAKAEPICEANTRANERILHNVGREVKHGELKLAARALTRAFTALNRAYDQLAAVPQPAADSATLARWLNYVKKGAVLFQETARALRVGNKARASSEESKLTHNAVLANDTVVSFEFHYCHLEPSRFIR